MIFIDQSSTLIDLKHAVSGSILTPTDVEYETLRRGWNLSIDQYPAIILVAENTADIIAGVNFARNQGFGVAVQSTGHGVKHPADDQLLILTSRLNEVQLDPQVRTARLGAGVIWQQVIDAAAPYGLAPLLGTSPNVGVVGYTLAGGIGWLARHYGLAADTVRRVDFVTADGIPRRATPTENSELFWGLRGGSAGNFGVVTALEIDLFPVSTIYGGSLVYPAEAAVEALHIYRAWVSSLPDEMTSSFIILKYPDLPQIPQAVRGKILVTVRGVYSGPVEEGPALIQPWLDWQQPLDNNFRTLPFSDIATISNDPIAPTPTRYSHEMLDTLSDEAIEVIVRHATDRRTALMVTEIRHAGGVISRVPPDTNAVSHRDAQFYLQMAAVGLDVEWVAAIDTAIRDFRAALQPYVRGSTYLNFILGHESAARAKSGYSPATYTRLQALKAQYDPDNLFRFSYPLPPSTSADR